MRRALWVLVAIVFLGLTGLAEGPWFIHLSWQHNPATTITIMWRSSPSVTESVVEYGLTPEFGKTVTGTRVTYTALRQEIVWHVVELTDLLPNTTYYYRCGAPGYWSGVYSFTTAPAPGDPSASFSFGIYGDSRGGYKVSGQILKALQEKGVRFIVFTGDFTNGAGQSEYDMWFKEAGEVLAFIPFMPVHGNHEMMKNTYFDQFALPGNEMWFSYDYGFVHFVHLLSQTEDYALQQRGWLLRDLKSTTLPWKIVIAHHPAYSAGKEHGCTQFVLDHWVDVFERCNVSIYFAGHDHIYERTWPIRNGRIDASGVVYVVTGGGGAPLHEAGRDWWTAVSESTYHYCVVDVQPSLLQVTAYRLDGSILDTFTLRK